MIGRRCKMGCGTWPDKAKFDVCPKCDQPTQRFKNLKPLSLPEAESSVRHIEFERYYETEHVVDSEPLSPRELAKLGLN